MFKTEQIKRAQQKLNNNEFVSDYETLIIILTEIKDLLSSINTHLGDK